jgi:ornithine cyclodeaminase/alanine dehydrogenase-like protein (mu-crystallin family)
MATAEAAVHGASIICTVTQARQPILEGEWLAPGAHINAVGSSTPDARELDTSAVRRAALFVDAKESTLNEAGDILTPIAEGAIGPDHIRAELGELLIGGHPGRQSSGEITLFKSLGLGIEDVAAARFVVAEARRLGMGQEVSLF